MTDHIVTSFVTVLTAIIGVAIIAVLVSQASNTAGVIAAGGSAFTNILAAAESPVTGGSGISGIINRGLGGL